MIYFLLCLCFILDGVISVLVSTSSLFLPLLTMITIVLIYPLLKNDKKDYFILIGAMGILYDICYGDVYLVNVIAFLLMGVFSYLLDHYLNNNIFTVILTIISSIIVYRLITYLLFLIVTHSSINILLFIKSIYESLILNSIYGFVLYYFINKKVTKCKTFKKKSIL